MLQVAAATEADARAVAGVVFSKFNLAAVDPEIDRWDVAAPAHEPRTPASDLEVTPSGAAAFGEHVLIVVQGPVEVRIDPSANAVRPGDLLQSAPIPASVGKVEELWIEERRLLREDRVLGVAIETPQPGRERMYMYVGRP